MRYKKNTVPETYEHLGFIDTILEKNSDNFCNFFVLHLFSDLL